MRLQCSMENHLFTYKLDCIAVFAKAIVKAFKINATRFVELKVNGLYLKFEWREFIKSMFWECEQTLL